MGENRMKQLLILLLVFAMLAIPAASATIDVNPVNIGSTNIKWSWDAAAGVTNISVDGYQVCYFDSNSHMFILSGLNPNETHTINVYSATDNGTNTTTTTGETSAGSAVAQFFKDWLIVLLCIGLLLCGFAMHRVFFWPAAFVALYGVYEYIEGSSAISANIVNIRFFICCGLFLLGLFFWMAKKGRG
jgi:hypothetical protein